MTTQLLFYANATPVSSERHRGLSVKAGTDYSFAAKTNSVPLTAVEFVRAAAEYAIVFAGGDDSVMPVVVLGAEADQNLFVKEDGGWNGKYIPAFVRRYPFVFSSNDKGKSFTLCLDELFAGCNQDGRGERLFDVQGERTQYLQTVLGFLQEYQAHFQRTKAFCARLSELGILVPMQAKFTLPDGRHNNLTGFQVVDRAKLKSLGDEVLAGLVRSDEMELIFLHLQSLQNFGKMLERGAKPAAESSDEKAEGDAEEPLTTH